uniref:NADH-ubiquinone oxidoreductase chain 4 n=1 Tax=Craspedacusta sowerbii TaxID=128124 RepID=A0A0S4LZ46_CRASO|nr:NADH dehydrogenase subunit 4 [Craspedacusta sowerbii]CUS58536.1 TPA: NADH dehydrogenase subunit 4 [Craspedacusta sowerbii]
MFLVPLFAFPILGILNVILTRRHQENKTKIRGLQWSIASLVYFFFLWWATPSHYRFSFHTSIEWLTLHQVKLNWGPLAFAIDGVSIFFIGLTILLIPICILVSWTSIRYLIKEFIISLFLIELLLIGVFTTLDILVFYVLFEGILIPMFIIIGVWGSREEKVRAAFYFFFYTLVGSLFMLICIFKIYELTGTTNYLTLLTLELPSDLQTWLFVGFFLSLAVKIPMIPFHIWLPQAHVEAPVAGSVVLAGILLKLGGYGFIRFSFPLFPCASEYVSPIVITLSLIAIVYGSFTTCRQNDMKRLIAYSSVAHMGLVTLSIFTHSIEGLVASLFLMMAHGFVSSGLFMGVTVLYDRHHTRSIRYYRGVCSSMPLFATLMLCLTLANISFPSTCNFIGEFLSILSAFQYAWWAGVLACSGVILSATYALYMYNRIFFGSLSPMILHNREMTRREFDALLPLLVFTLLLGIFPNALLYGMTMGSYATVGSI